RNRPQASDSHGGFARAKSTVIVSMAVASIAENLERVYEQIAQAASKVGHAAQEIELVAITKTHPAEKVREAIEAGQTLFGESRGQGARAKSPKVTSDLPCG